MAANCSRFCSNRSASLVRYLPRCSGVVDDHEPFKAFRAAATAISTSLSVASCTETMGFSFEGLMDSNVLPSTPLTNSLFMKLSLEKKRVISNHIAGQSAEVRFGQRHGVVYGWWGVVW